MEWKIGEIKQVNGEWYQCLECTGCHKCDFNIDENTCGIENPYCISRSDKKDVIFKKLEKVGEPYTRYISKNKSIIVQRYKLYCRNAIVPNEPIMLLEPNYKNSIEIEIKQNMKEEKHSNLESTGENLKQFNLEEAKAGKPVCTRDGRKARIICFDKRGEQPIVALIEKNEEESIDTFFSNGYSISKTNKVVGDLMMIPEKKEGWVNVYKGIDGITFSKHPHSSKEEAIKEAGGTLSGRIDTVKISWEE